MLTNPLKATEYMPSSTVRLETHSHPKSRLKSVFFGPNGLRAGWRMLISSARDQHLCVARVDCFLCSADGRQLDNHRAGRKGPSPGLVGSTGRLPAHATGSLVRGGLDPPPQISGTERSEKSSGRT